MTDKKEGCCGTHNHDHGQGCGCGHDHDHHHEHDHEHAHVPAVIYLEMENGEELACDVLAIFELGDKEYIAVLPQETEIAYLYGYEETEEGPSLYNIEDDAEYEKVSQTFQEIVDAQSEEA